MMETTRRFPRTLNEAFPNSFEYGYAIEVYRAPLIDRIFRFFFGAF